MPDGSPQAHTKKTQVLGKACQESNYRTSEMPGRRVLCYRTVERQARNGVKSSAGSLGCRLIFTMVFMTDLGNFPRAAGP